MTYNRYMIVKVPFPFTDKVASKNRPALIISDAELFNNRIEHSVMAMITSTKQSDWPLDTVITGLDCAGLQKVLCFIDPSGHHDQFAVIRPL